MECLGSLMIFFFYLSFLSRTFTIHRTAGKGGGYLFNSSLPLPPASQTLRHQPGNNCREFNSAHSQQLDSNREPLVSKHKSLTTKLRPLNVFQLAITTSWFNLIDYGNATEHLEDAYHCKQKKLCLISFKVLQGDLGFLPNAGVSSISLDQSFEYQFNSSSHTLREEIGKWVLLM